MEIVITIFIIVGVVVGAMLLDSAIERHYQKKIDRELFKNEFDKHIVASILVKRGKKL